MWSKAKESLPTETASVAQEPAKRTRICEAIQSSIANNEKWIQASTQISDFEKSVMQFLNQVQSQMHRGDAAEAAGTASAAVPAPPQQTAPPMDVATRIEQLNDLHSRGLITQQLHAELVAKALGL